MSTRLIQAAAMVVAVMVTARQKRTPLMEGANSRRPR
jgi:hypothetical protein